MLRGAERKLLENVKGETRCLDDHILVSKETNLDVHKFIFFMIVQ